jgi:4-amino-4-deoxy-L-arabinose transferase-like glycosyltransferase
VKKLTFQSFSLKALSLLTALAFIPITITSFMAVSEAYTSHTTIWAVLLFAAVTILLLGFFSLKWFGRKLFIAILLLLAVGIRLAWISTIDTRIYSDFEVMYNAAIRAARGDFGFTTESEYFFRWAYQLGFTMYEALILKLSGGSLFTLKFMNVLFSAGTALFVYLIGAKLFNEAAGRISGILYAVLIPNIAMASVLTNQHLAAFLFYLSFYLLIQFFEKSRWIWILVGILLSFGDIIRPLGSVILIAVSLYVLVAYLFGAKKKKLLSAGKLAGILAVFYLTHFLISTAFISTGVTNYPIANNEPLWKFVTGLNQDSRGIFSDEDAKYLAHFKLGKQRDDVEKELVKERIADKGQLMELFRDKFLYMWTERDGQLIWGLRSKVQDHTELLANLTMFERWLYISMAFFVFVATLRLCFERTSNPGTALFLLLIIGYMLVHLLIEIQTRYRYFIYPSFVIFQGYGVFIVWALFKKVLHLKRSPE